MEPPSQFSANFYCGQTAGCIKMPLGMEVVLAPQDFVLDGDPVPPPSHQKKAMFIVAKWLDKSRCHLVQMDSTVSPYAIGLLSVLSVCLSVCLPVCL